ncbi:hypothetical protein HPP92_003076 [Vanilla planifolia]|uniref:Uncharacterized protein n=1 Tax=Vanilla planifolia TaxID=51239 RepID=A0A835VJJ1_VANPL|nr:hypothetical protein HPP92_003076 [Vanilla planifolia]
MAADDTRTAPPRETRLTRSTRTRTGEDEDAQGKGKKSRLFFRIGNYRSPTKVPLYCVEEEEIEEVDDGGQLCTSKWRPGRWADGIVEKKRL